MATLNDNYSRRSFLKMSAAMAAALGLTACGPAQQGTTQDTSSAEASASASGAATAFGVDGKLRVGMEAAYAPYNWQETSSNEFTIPIENVNGAYADGYDVQVAKRIAEKLGLEPVAIKLEWDGLIDSLNQGQIDCIIAGMTATPERAESIDFTEPYYDGTYCLVVQKDSQYANATSLADFEGAAVLGQKDTLLDTMIDEIPGVNHLTPVETVPNQVSQLASGTCDAITFDSANVPGVVRANPNFVGIIFEEGKGFSESVPVNIGVAKGHDDIIATMNDVLASFTEDERQKLLVEVVDRQPV
ncbi:MAG: transporter substrate-binding domain-containing protein [Atopobiaceae bacterium]|nr:transporter substrate-binding domain-containing protein [Atopobiaceae bacterium]